MRVPVALLAIPFLTGCAAGILTFDRHPDIFPLLMASAAVFAWLAAASSCGDGCAAECCIAIVIGAACAGLSLGGVAAAQAYESPLLEWFDALPDGSQEPATIEGRIVEDAGLTASGASLTIGVSRAEQGSRVLECARGCGGIRIAVSGTMTATRAAQWRAGRHLRATALLRHPSVYRNPGVPDEKRSLARRGVVLVGTVKSAALVEVVDAGSGLDESAARVRAWSRERLSAAIGGWSTRSAAIAIAILIGDRTGLPAGDERRLQRAGTYHVIAISGGNIAILAALLLGILALLPLPSRLGAGGTIAGLLFYGRMAGAAASVDRAVTVAVLYLAARVVDRPGPPLNALAVAASLALTISPLVVLDPGFVLSFGATVAIVVGVPRLLPPRRRERSRTARVVRGAVLVAGALLAATVCADLALTPVAATLFSRVTFAGLLLNFIAIPLMAVVQASALAVLALADLTPTGAAYCGYIVHLAATGLVESSRLVDVMPWLAREVSPPAWWLLAAYYSGLVVVIMVGRLRRWAAAVTIACGIAIVAGLPITAADAVAPPPSGTLRVAVFDVGQGDSTLVALPTGRTLLVDAGGLPGAAFDVGERVVVPAMRALRVRQLDTFVVTHGDPDHIGGAAALLTILRPSSIWEGIPVPPHDGLRTLHDIAVQTGASWRYLQAGDVERAGGVEITVLHPPPPEWERQRVRNEDSVVLEIRMGDVAVILPGDIGGEGERAIVPRLTRAKTVILKAPHHGSATSSTQALLDALQPAAVIVSAGRGNRFGHPHPSVVARYNAMGTEVFSTKEDGAVIVETDGTKAEVRGWWSGRRSTF